MEAICEPERVVQFRIPWLNDKNELVVNRGFRVQFNQAIGPYKESVGTSGLCAPTYYGLVDAFFSKKSNFSYFYSEDILDVLVLSTSNGKSNAASEISRGTRLCIYSWHTYI